MTLITNSTCAKCGSAQSHNDFFCQQCHFPLAQAGMTITFVKPTSTPSTQAEPQPAAHPQEIPNNERIEAQPSLTTSAAFDSADTAVMLSNVSGPGEPAQPASPNNVSSQLPHFKINEVLGFGGMGTVYRAQDLSLGRYVALKLFHCPRLAQSEGHQRLLAEARLACQLNHPNIVTIYDIARGEQTDFFVMEWVDGLPLNKLLPEHGFELLTALDYALQLLDGLACAHKSEIIHRDIKPQNIMVNRSERIKILDFGIASLLQEAKEHAAEPVSGTWLYMAPEQLNGEPADARADLFAFGVTFYEMLTGQKPFDGNNPQALLSAITASEVKAVSEVKPTLPKALDDILAKLLKADKNERYQNAEQVSQDLAAVQHALTAQKNWWQRRNLATKAALVLPIIALLGYSLQQVLLPPTTQELVARQLVEAKKIAILPFDNISGDPTLQVFADAVVSSLGSDLTRIGYEQGDGSSWVIPVSEVRSLKAQTSKAVYDNYAADLVLTGSIQHMGSTRRVVLNLQSAADGRILNTTELSIAADKLFDGQAEVREEVVNLLGWSVSDTLKSSFAAHRPQLDGAYKAYLEGIGYLYRFDQPQNLNKASAAFQSAIELDNGYTDAYVGLAKTQLRLFAESRDGQWLSAMEHTIALLEQIDPKLPELNSLFGSLYNEKGLYQQAVDALTQSLQKNSFDIEAYRRLAWAYSNLNQFEKAKAVFEQALTIAPHDVSVKLNLGLLYKEHAQYHKAIELFQALIQAVPNHKFAYQNMANSYLILGEIDKAISYTLKAIDINPTATSYSALGTMFFSKQDYQAAVQAFEKAITINSQSYIIWGNLADSYRFANSEKTEGAYRQAIILAEKSLSINPRSGLTLSVLSYYLACVGERERALTYAKKITSSHAGAYHFYVAITYATLENTSEALAHLAVAIEKNYPLDEILTTSLLADLRTKSEFNQFLSNLKPK